MDPNLVSNKNFGAGRQENFTQIGGSNNVQYNADIINYHGERAQEPTRTSPPPSSTVPFHRDPNFVDRPELGKLEEKLSVWNKKVALVGIGGVGKSQLAIEFCYRVRDRSPEVWVFWIHASSAARFDADIRKLACDAGISGWNDPKCDAFALVCSWLRDERNGKWILVLDNVDDASFLFEKPNANDQSARTRLAYLPPCAHGSTLITSRSRAATARLTDECDVIVVCPMGEATALALLEKKLGQKAAIEDMQKLVVALDYMPLALAQAAAYIMQRTPRFSVGRFLDRLEKNEKSQTSLLTSASKELRRDEEAQDSIIPTWQISFEHIRNERRSAADLLSLMCMYNHQGIPDYLILAGWNDTNEDEEDESFEEDILTLKKFLFIDTTLSSVNRFEMHRLVQLAARAWLRSQGKYHEWARKACRQLDEAVPDDRPEIWGRCEELHPHVTSTLTLHIQDHEPSLQRTLVQDDASSEVSLDWASIQWRAARFNWRRGLHSKLGLLMAESYETRAALLETEHLATWFTSDLQVLLLSFEEKCEAAEQALKGFESELGKDHRNTLISVGRLEAFVSKMQGKCEATKEADRQALQAFEKMLGTDHRNTLTSTGDLASMLNMQEKSEALEEANRQALKSLEKMLGKKHSVTLTSISNLAAVLGHQGKYEAAEEATRRALEGFEKVLGKKHYDTLITAWRLAALMEHLERQADAVSLYKRAATGLSTSLGARHPDTLQCQRSLERLQEQCHVEEC